MLGVMVLAGVPSALCPDLEDGVVVREVRLLTTGLKRAGGNFLNQHYVG